MAHYSISTEDLMGVINSYPQTEIENEILINRDDVVQICKEIISLIDPNK